MTLMQTDKEITIGILALQGDYEAHKKMLSHIGGAATLLVRSVEELHMCDGMIIPGGESTTIGKLLVKHDIIDPLIRKVQDGMPLYGTCAGMILMAKEIAGSEQTRLGVTNISVARNAFGRQVDSFEAQIPFASLEGDPVEGVFIRAPYVTKTWGEVEILAKYQDKIVGIREKNMLAIAFHPELTSDTRVHELFLEMVRSAVRGASNP